MRTVSRGLYCTDCIVRIVSWDCIVELENAIVSIELEAIRIPNGNDVSP